jgi:ketol-acid reductoisomerase
MSNQSVEMIRKDALIPVTIGTGFYARLREVLMSTLQDRTPEEIQEANTQIETGSITQEWVRNYETMVVLCKEIERQASEHGMTYTSDLTTEVEQMVTEAEASETTLD